jgi:hypothetical protein
MTEFSITLMPQVWAFPEAMVLNPPEGGVA